MLLWLEDVLGVNSEFEACSEVEVSRCGGLRRDLNLEGSNIPVAWVSFIGTPYTILFRNIVLCSFCVDCFDFGLGVSGSASKA